MNTLNHSVNQGGQFGRQEGIGIAGNNLGFGFCKLVLDGQEHSYMSALTPLNAGVDGLAQRKPDRMNVVLGEDGKLYEAGVDGVLNSTEEPLKNLSREWARSKQYKLLMGAALNRMAATGKRQWVVATGLAADHYKDAAYRADVTKLWMGNHGMHATPHGDVEILSVKVLPETAGGFFELMADREIYSLIRASSGVVVDFGRMTVNWLPFRGDITDGNRFSSVDVGVSNVITEATKLVRLDARRPDLHPLDVEAAMLGIRSIQKLVEVSPGKLEPRTVPMDIPVTKAVAEVWPRIEQALANNLGDLRGKLIIGIGGGSKVFGQALKDTYSNSTVILPEDGQMTNARGMYRMARHNTLKAMG